MNDTMAELTKLDRETYSLGEQATALEQQAQTLRRKREELKLEAAKVRKIVTDSQLLSITENALKAAQESERQATQFANEVKVQLDTLRTEREALKKLMEECRATIDALKTTTPPQ